MKVPGIWHKKTWKNLEFRTKNLRENLEFGIWEKLGTYMTSACVTLLVQSIKHNVRKNVIIKF